MAAGETGAELIALDVHAHLVPIAADRLAQIAGVTWDGAANALTVDGHAMRVPALYQPEALVARMDGRRVEQASISVPPPFYRKHLAEGASREWVQYLNDGLAQICMRFPQRLAPLFQPPVEHPELAAQPVAQRTAQGARGFSMAAGGGATPVYSFTELRGST